MNAYEELAGYRFASGRDYDKRSVEMFRARVLNLVDELLNQLTQLHDEVADLRDRTRVVPAESFVAAPAGAPVVPTTWLEALAAASELPGDGKLAMAPAAASTPPAFPAPPVASWLAALDGTSGADDDGARAGSTAELLLAAAGNAGAVQAAAVAGAAPEPTAPRDAAAFTAPIAAVPAPVAPATAPASASADPVDVPPPPAVPAWAPIPPPPPPQPRVESTPLVVTPGDEVVVTAPVALVERLPIVLDDGLPDHPPLPSPMRHWGGWMR